MREIRLDRFQTKRVTTQFQQEASLFFPIVFGNASKVHIFSIIYLIGLPIIDFCKSFFNLFFIKADIGKWSVKSLGIYRLPLRKRRADKICKKCKRSLLPRRKGACNGM